MSAQLDDALPSFFHEAFIYDDERSYVAGTVPFIEEGLEAGEAVLVAVPTRKVELLRDSLTDPTDSRLKLVSMEEMGRNPAWIIPAWADFVAPHTAAGRTARGIGEPIWFGRSEDELVECTRHEALLNLAFSDADGFTLLCPYNASNLDPEIIDGAIHNHPHVTQGGITVPSSAYDDDLGSQLEIPLSPVPSDAVTVDFDAASLASVRHLTGDLGQAAGLSPARTDELLLAVSEVITNSVRHAGGAGRIALWRDGDRLLCDVRDRGRIADPLAGRVRPKIGQIGGRGMWLMHQLCDLVQIRNLPEGQVIRLHITP
jgi:anti-sigma regulatory factor (Ser/Thr protein kinase)